MHPKPDIPPGTLDMLVLNTLARFGPMHGYGIAKLILQTSDEVLRVEEGSLYPALQRIVRSGWVTAEWVAAGPKRRARVYDLLRKSLFITVRVCKGLSVRRIYTDGLFCGEGRGQARRERRV